MRRATSTLLLAIASLLLPGCSLEVDSSPAAPPASSVDVHPTQTAPPGAGSPIDGAHARAAETQGEGIEPASERVRSLEARFASLWQDSEERLALARRLVYAYVELETADAQGPSRAEAANRAHAGARKYLSLIVHDYPRYPELDEVLYELGYEYQQAHESDLARTNYYLLIANHPGSKFVPNAYLAFGELFFEEAQADPSKWELASIAYMKVIAFPPPENGVYVYAWYKLAFVYWNTGRFEMACNALKKTIVHGEALAERPETARLVSAARKDIIAVYAMKGDPAAAYAFFREVSGDPAGVDEKALEMMGALGKRYTETGHYPEAVALYKDLSARVPAAGKALVLSRLEAAAHLAGDTTSTP
jgi:tetratricopeptide (TPR) repeat protein